MMAISNGLTYAPLGTDIRQDSAIGAEIKLPAGSPLLDLKSLSSADRESLCKALFENQVVVIRNQQGIDPKVLPELAKVFDESASDIHSAGVKAVSDPRNILSAYKAGRIPRAPQVGIIGTGKFENYEGLESLDLVHLVCQPLNQTGRKTSSQRSLLMLAIKGSHPVSRVAFERGRARARLHAPLPLAHGHAFL